MKQTFIILLLVLFIFNLALTQALYFPPNTGDSWEKYSLSDLNWCEDKVPALYQFLEEKNSKAFILLKDGKIVLEKYFGSFKQDSLWYWASAGKGLTSLLIGMAQDAGKLRLDDISSKYLGSPWTSMTKEQEDKISIWHQLSMTSGMDDITVDAYCTDIACLKFKADAGTRWAYHNAPYTLLDKVFAKAMDQSLNAFITQKIRPITGINGAFFKSGYNNVFLSTPRVMARFGLLMLAKGKWKDTRMISENYYNMMITPSQNINLSYGLLWWLNGKASYMVPGLQIKIPGSLARFAPKDMFSALGKNGQIIDVVPSQNLILIRMGNAPGAAEVPYTLNDSIWMYLEPVLCNTTSTNEMALTNTVRIFPNPASSFLYVERQTMLNEKWNISLFSIHGKLQANYTLNSGIERVEILTANYCPGMYQILISRPTGSKILQKLLLE